MFFQFEGDFVDSLQCIPMSVRLKLDTCGIKLKLNQWNHFNREQRQVLIELPCNNSEEINTYRERLQELILGQTGTAASELPIDDHPQWLNTETIPIEVQEKAQEFNVNISLEQWEKLQPLQRFALIKLSRSSHENSNFLPAFKEFDLLK
ncbi:MAG TPA: nitrate reductase associated protein [Allocoleopsis sp.]